MAAVWQGARNDAVALFLSIFQATIKCRPTIKAEPSVLHQDNLGIYAFQTPRVQHVVVHIISVEFLLFKINTPTPPIDSQPLSLSTMMYPHMLYKKKSFIQPLGVQIL